MLVEIDETRLDKISHIEIRRRKEGIAVIEVPKTKTIKTIKDNIPLNEKG